MDKNRKDVQKESNEDNHRRHHETDALMVDQGEMEEFEKRCTR